MCGIRLVDLLSKSKFAALLSKSKFVDLFSKSKLVVLLNKSKLVDILSENKLVDLLLVVGKSILTECCDRIGLSMTFKLTLQSALCEKGL